MLDPFGGSGTTLAVAKKLGRRFIGFELSKNYVTKVQKRLEETKQGDALWGAEEPKVSAPSTANGRKLGTVEHTGKRRSKAKARSAEAVEVLSDSD